MVGVNTPSAVDLSFDKQAAAIGIKQTIPLVIPGIPFGFVLGLIIQEEGLPRFAGWSSSWLIFAGSSQLAALNLLADGASAAVIIVSVFLINSRHAMYSAAMRDRFAPLPLWFRILGPYFLIDQSFAVAETSPDLIDPTPRFRMWHFLGAGVAVWSMWQLSVAAGVLIGNVVREEWALSFAVPILFLGLMVFSIKNKPGVLAAVVGATIAFVGRTLPQGSGLLLAIILGMAAGGLAETRMARQTS